MEKLPYENNKEAQEIDKEIEEFKSTLSDNSDELFMLRSSLTEQMDAMQLNQDHNHY